MTVAQRQQVNPDVVRMMATLDNAFVKLTSTVALALISPSPRYAVDRYTLLAPNIAQFASSDRPVTALLLPNHLQHDSVILNWIGALLAPT